MRSFINFIHTFVPSHDTGSYITKRNIATENDRLPQNPSSNLFNGIAFPFLVIPSFANRCLINHM